jgi:hypothetical protein
LSLTAFDGASAVLLRIPEPEPVGSNRGRAAVMGNARHGGRRMTLQQFVADVLPQLIDSPGADWIEGTARRSQADNRQEEDPKGRPFGCSGCTAFRNRGRIKIPTQCLQTMAASWI